MRAALVAVLLVACQKQDAGPPCDKVVDHMLDVMKEQLPGHEGMGMTGERKAMVEQCEQRKYTAQERTCLLAAKNLDGFAACRPTKVPPTLHPAKPAVPPAPSTPPVPAGSGSG